MTGDARLEFLRPFFGPAPEMREHGARGPVGYQPTNSDDCEHIFTFRRMISFKFKMSNYEILNSYEYQIHNEIEKPSSDTFRIKYLFTSSSNSIQIEI